MARATTNMLDSGDVFPPLEMQTVNHGPVKLPDWFEGNWGVLLVYRGHW